MAKMDINIFFGITGSHRVYGIYAIEVVYRQPFEYSLRAVGFVVLKSKLKSLNKKKCKKVQHERPPLEI